MKNKCKYCGAEITSKKSFCSQICKNKFHYNKKQIKKCLICNKEFLSNKGKKFCSKECSLISQRNRVKKCATCNEEFFSRGNGVYCSNECYRIANSKYSSLEIRKCFVCGKNYRIKKNIESEVCSDKCLNDLINYSVEKSFKYIKEKINEKKIQI